LFDARIVHAEQSRYQKIILTKKQDDVRLYLNGNIQFSSRDEYRYHEALINFPLAYKQGNVKRVLLLGAGDGLAVKQLLKFEEIEEIVLVDLDQAVIDLARVNPHLLKLNEGSLEDPRVSIVVDDAYSFLQENTQAFDYIISDLPDPNNIELARLYTKQFFQTLKQNLSANGVFVTQATSPYFATKAFWSIHHTLNASGFAYTVPYRADVPSFGDWGFIMASDNSLDTLSSRDVFEHGQFLSPSLLPAMRTFAKDQARVDVEINSIDQPKLLAYYLEGWKKFGY
jgi:spermidine synthase